MQADTTLDHYREVYWLPRLFDRTGWHAFASGEGKSALQRAQEELRARLDAYAYQPPEGIREVRRIFAEAWRALGGDTEAEYLGFLYNE